jgi:hypothetical protein
MVSGGGRGKASRDAGLRQVRSLLSRVLSFLVICGAVSVCLVLGLVAGALQGQGVPPESIELHSSAQDRSPIANNSG